jgi:hypothetical protein
VLLWRIVCPALQAGHSALKIMEQVWAFRVSTEEAHHIRLFHTMPDKIIICMVLL